MASKDRKPTAEQMIAERPVMCAIAANPHLTQGTPAPPPSRIPTWRTVQVGRAVTSDKEEKWRQ